MAGTELQDRWIERVLGVGIGSAKSAAGTLSLVKLGKSRIEWIGVRRAAVAGIGQLRDAIAQEFAADPEQAGALQQALGMLDTLVGQLDSRLEANLDAVLNAAAGRDQAAALAAARRMLEAAMALVDGDPLMSELDGNEILPDLAVQAPLKAKLADIAAALG